MMQESKEENMSVKNENKNTHKRETKGIKAHAKKKSEEAYKRVDFALREMALNKEPINFIYISIMYHKVYLLRLQAHL